MQHGRLTSSDDQRTVVARALRTTNAWDRLRGLLGRPALKPDQGLLLDPCGSVHTLFMAYPIDLVYLSRDLCVIRVVSPLTPWRASACLGARMTLELPAGAAAASGIEAGQQLRWIPVDGT